MMKTRILATVLSVSLIGSAAISAMAAEPPSDTSTVPSVVISYQDDAPLSRADLVTLLYEASGSPAVNYAMNYTDVDGDAAYADAVRWASSEELITGYGDGTFRPDDTITREQLAVILYRCAQSHDQGFTGAWAFPLPYDDAAAIHDYAYEAVCWMSMKQIIGDAEDRTFAPDRAVSHGEAEEILQLFQETMEQTA